MMLSRPGSIVHIIQLTAYTARPMLTVMKREMRNMGAKMLLRSSTIPPRVTFRRSSWGNGYRRKRKNQVIVISEKR